MALRWFRSGKKEQEEAAAPEAVALEVQAPPETQAPEPTEAQDAPEGPRKRRRRGSRGGRGRKKPGAAQAAGETPGEPDDAASDDAASDSARTGPDRKTERTGERKTERKTDKRSQRSTRRRTPTKRAPLPAAKRELLISVDVGEQRVAILEDDRVAEVYLERPERRSIAGNIYLGVVDNVLPGMEAAFVEIGLEKNGFLFVDEIVGPELEGRKGARKIQDLIKRGQTILVQAVKDPMKSKGARLTTEISLPGRFLVYVPNGEGSGVSRRIEDAERTRLKEIVRNLDPKGGGIIVRTAAEGASAEDIERDLVFLQRLWKTIQTKAKGATAPALVYEEAELPLRIVRDLFAGDFVGAQIDDDRTHRRIVSYLKKTSPHMIERVHRYREKAPLFEASGVEQEIRSTLERRVDLPSGGYLVFDYAEAFTVIDVNTGRFVGSRAKNSAGRLEDTITANNLEAVKEVVHQLRLRDIGGIIVIDFIDMGSPKNRATVEEALKNELERDRTKTYVVEISPLGLVEMTRQNVTEGPREILTQKCPTCAGDGIVLSTHSAAIDAERRLRALAVGSKRGVEAIRVELEENVAVHVIGPGASRLTEIERLAKRRFFLEGKAGAPLDHFKVVAEGKLADIAPKASLEEGSEVRVELVEVGKHDVTAGMGKLDGLDICIADASKLVGKKVKARIERVLDGMAYATLVTPATAKVDAPITAEAEAEKPTRAPRKKVEPKAGAVEAPAAEEQEEEEPVAEAVDEPVDAVAEVEEPPTEEPPVDEPDAVATTDAPATPRKRTRRGSRGGRNRRKKPAGAAAAAAENGQPPAEQVPEPKPQREPRPQAKPDGARAATIHVPSADLGTEDNGGAPAAEGDGPPKKKRTRRGSRGGRNRRKKPAGASAEAKPESSSD